MKILFIVSSLDMGGIERMLISCIEYYRLRGYNNIHILSSSGGILKSEFENNNVVVHINPKNANPLKQIFLVRELQKKYGFDIINSNFGHTSGLLAFLTYLLKVPFYISVHNQQAMFKLSWRRKYLLSKLRTLYLGIHKYLSLIFAKKIIAHSETNSIYYKNKINLNKKIVSVKNGVNFGELTERNNLSDERAKRLSNFVKDKNIVFIHIGSFKDQKNHIFLLELFSKIKAVENKIALILMGDGGLRPQIEFTIGKLGLENNILLTGVDMNVYSYLSKSDAFVFPSLYEGFGNVLIEAQYLNLPILASDILPHYESVYEGYHKYFFNPLDINDAFNKLESFIQDYKQLNHMHEAYVFSQKFTIENMTNSIIDIYEEK